LLLSQALFMNACDFLRGYFLLQALAFAELVLSLDIPIFSEPSAHGTANYL